MIFDYVGILLDKKAISDKEFIINVKLTDTKENITLHFVNGALLQYHNYLSESPDLTITCPKNALALIIQGNMEKISASMKLEGDVTVLKTMVDNLNQFSATDNANFNIIEP